MVLVLILLLAVIYVGYELYKQYEVAKAVEIVDFSLEIAGIRLERREVKISQSVDVRLRINLYNNARHNLDVYITSVRLLVNGICIGSSEQPVRLYVPAGGESVVEVPIRLREEGSKLLLAKLWEYVLLGKKAMVVMEVRIEVPIKLAGREMFRLPFSFTLAKPLP